VLLLELLRLLVVLLELLRLLVVLLKLLLVLPKQVVLLLAVGFTKCRAIMVECNKKVVCKSKIKQVHI